MACDCGWSGGQQVRSGRRNVRGGNDMRRKQKGHRSESEKISLRYLYCKEELITCAVKVVLEEKKERFKRVVNLAKLISLDNVRQQVSYSFILESLAIVMTMSSLNIMVA